MDGYIDDVTIIYGWIDVWIDRWVDGWIDGWMDGQMMDDGQMDG